ncbi:hypothetical protein PTSG_02605 [Salpingoeca rosetta]|uniref:Fungal lipase-like domain-containing protein n=1 Tax=Salpingoeca rosetta (strain ATCC 50818 / BSB-021) TaxID=946362 RepID=F2U2S5_SALR5|nr:uncharacterized protein PTSG_02605 [Salpingoeca rosetta]EGD81919.1 hypothetical protein PTSG_02605 [Salpingoeca rosetta]|eukprot:XP_004996102.1 hypothetical protein PTSG_02605 [Salpingoeca rosetta]
MTTTATVTRVTVDDLQQAVSTFGLMRDGERHVVTFCHQGSRLFEEGVRCGHVLTRVEAGDPVKANEASLGVDVAVIRFVSAEPVTPARLMDQTFAQRLRGHPATLVFQHVPRLPPDVIRRRDTDMCLLLAQCLSNGGSNQEVAIQRHFNQNLDKRDGYHQLKEVAFTRNAAESHHFTVAFGSDDPLNGEDTTPVYICFQSTQTLQHAMTDMTAFALPPMSGAIEGRVHVGFLHVAEKIPVEPFVRLLHGSPGDKKKYRLVFCGHSLGGALAQLVALRVLLECHQRDDRRNVHVVTFGAPLVGDRAFAQQFEREIGGADVAHSNCRFHVYNNDIVPRVLTLLTRAFSSQADARTRSSLVTEVLNKAFNQPETHSSFFDGIMSVFSRNATGSLWVTLASCLHSLVKQCVECDYSPFGTYLIYEDSQWKPYNNPNEIHAALFKNDTLPQLKAELLKHHFLDHYCQGHHFNRHAWYPQQTSKVPTFTQHPDFSAPRKLMFQSDHSSTTSTANSQQHHLTFTGDGFAFVTHVTSSLDGHSCEFTPVILDGGKRLEVTISCTTQQAKAVFDVRLYTVFTAPASTVPVDVTQLSKLPLFGKLAQAAKLSRHDVINQAFLLTLFSDDKEKQEKVLRILTELEEGEVTPAAKRWHESDQDEAAAALREVVGSTISIEELKYQDERTKPLQKAIQVMAEQEGGGRGFGALTDASKEVLGRDATNAKAFADKMRDAVRKYQVYDPPAGETYADRHEQRLPYKRASEWFRSDKSTCAQDALRAVSWSTLDVLARTGYPDIAVKKGPGIIALTTAITIVMAGLAVFSLLGIVAGIYDLSLEVGGLTMLTGSVSAFLLAGVLGKVLAKLNENQAEYQKNLQLMLQLLGLDEEKDLPLDPTYFAEKAIVQKGIAQKMKVIVGHSIDPAALMSAEFRAKYFSKLKQGDPLYNVTDDDTARKRALLFLRDVWLIFRLRKVLAGTFMFGVVGTTKTGKSTFLSRLKFKSNPDSAVNSTRIEFYKWPAARHFVFVDFPGSDDATKKVEEAFAAHYSIVDACIFVVEADKPNTARVKDALLAALRREVPILLCLNKADLLLPRPLQQQQDELPIAQSPDSAAAEVTSPVDDGDDDDDDDGYDDFEELGPLTPLRTQEELHDILRKKIQLTLGGANPHVTIDKESGLHTVEVQRASEDKQAFSTCLTCFAPHLGPVVKPSDLQERAIFTPKVVLEQWLFPTLKACEIPVEEPEYKEILAYLRRR